MGKGADSNDPQHMPLYVCVCVCKGRWLDSTATNIQKRKKNSTKCPKTFRQTDKDKNNEQPTCGQIFGADTVNCLAPDFPGGAWGDESGQGI